MEKPQRSPHRPVLAALLALSLLTLAGEAAAQDADVEDVTARDVARRAPRLRFGVSGVAGGFAGQVHGGLGGVSPRIGVQVNDVAAFYLQAHGLLGAFGPHPEGPSLAGFAFHEAMFELTFDDTFQVGAGPSLDYLWGCSEGNRSPDCNGGGPFFGSDFRAALVLGGRDEGRRDGLSISVDVHPTWIDHDVATVFLVGVGIESF